jgi:hypothetical protein
MTGRAEEANRRADEAELRAEVAVRQARALKLSLAALQLRLQATAASSRDLGPATGINRQARSQAVPARQPPRR